MTPLPVLGVPVESQGAERPGLPAVDRADAGRRAGRRRSRSARPARPTPRCSRPAILALGDARARAAARRLARGADRASVADRLPNDRPAARLDDRHPRRRPARPDARRWPRRSSATTCHIFDPARAARRGRRRRLPHARRLRPIVEALRRFGAARRRRDLRVRERAGREPLDVLAAKLAPRHRARSPSRRTG